MNHKSQSLYHLTQGCLTFIELLFGFGSICSYGHLFPALSSLLKLLISGWDVACRTFRENLEFPVVGSKPKYLMEISCPTCSPNTLGWFIWNEK